MSVHATIKPRPGRRGRPKAVRARETLQRSLPRVVWGWMILAALVRLPFLAWIGLWIEEVHLRNLVAQPIADIMQSPQALHGLIVKFFLAFDDGGFFLRLPSALMGIFSVALGFAVARRLFGKRTALIFSFFLAVAPWFIFYSIDARSPGPMMFWTLAGVYGYARLQEGGSMWNLLLTALALFCGALVHPFFGAFILAFIAFVLIQLVFTEGYAERLPFSPRLYETPLHRFATLLIALIAASACLFVLSAGGLFPHLLARVLSFEAKFTWGLSPENIGFTYDFFYSFLRRIGPAAIPHASWGATEPLIGPLATWLMFALYAAGGALSARTNPLLPLLFIFPPAMSFVLIFNYDSSRDFPMENLGFLVPLYWLGISRALTEIGDRIGLLFASAGDESRRALPRAIPVAAVVFLFLPQYIHLLVFDGRNWDAVMSVIAERIEPGESIVYSNAQEGDLLDYYLSQYKLDALETSQLPYNSNRGKFTESKLKAICNQTPGLWFLSNRSEPFSEEAFAWAQAHMEPVALGRSFFGAGHDVSAYFWGYGSRAIMPPRKLRYRPSADQAGASTTFEESFLFETPGNYEIRAYSDDGIVEMLHASLGDLKFDLKYQQSNTSLGYLYRSAPIGVGSGIQTLTLSSPGGPLSYQFIEVVRRYPRAEIVIPASSCDEIYPSAWTWILGEGDAAILCLKRNTFAGYDFSLAESGAYEFTCEGRNDRPRPILVELRLDDQAIGVLNFDKKDNSWETKSFPLALNAGDHALTVRFLNEGDVFAQEPDEDSDAWFRLFTLRPYMESAQPRDDRIVIPRTKPRPIVLAQSDADELLDDWTLSGQEDWITKIERDDQGDALLSTAVTGWNEKTSVMELRGPIQTLRQPGLIYYSALLRCENLQNHDINLMTRYLDADGRQVREATVNQQGLTGTTDWVRIVAFKWVEPEITAFQPIFWVYPKSQPQASQGGTVYCKGFQVEAN